MILKGRILNQGKGIVSAALVGLASSYAAGFKVGDVSGFTVDPTETAPRGEVTFEGKTEDVAVTRVSLDTVRFVCSISESHGPFRIGNIVLYMRDENGNAVPFVMVAFPFAVLKQPSADQVTTDGFTLPGSRFAVAITIKHSDELNDVEVVVLPPDYSSLATFANENEVPPGAALTFKQFVVAYDTRARTPVLFTVDHENVRWGNPFYQQIRDHRFGQLDGGMDGEGYGGEPDELVFGMFYTTDEADYTENPAGGAAYTDSTVLQTLGGSTYTKTTNTNPYEVIP